MKIIIRDYDEERPSRSHDLLVRIQMAVDMANNVFELDRCEDEYFTTVDYKELVEKANMLINARNQRSGRIEDIGMEVHLSGDECSLDSIEVWWKED